MQGDKLHKIDIFKLATQLGFDCRGAILNDYDGFILVNEKIDVIKGFNSNKVIAYNCTNNIDRTCLIISNLLLEYLNKKCENDKVYFASKIYRGNVVYKIERDVLLDDILCAGFIEENNIQKIYRSIND